jgi:small subunit ribosomal protein S13
MSSQTILTKANVDFNIRTNNLTDENVSSIREILESEYIVESDLKRKVSLNIKRLSEINCYSGKRHRLQLPLRGQRTRTNARTRRGSKKTVAAKKK